MNWTSETTKTDRENAYVQNFKQTLDQTLIKWQTLTTYKEHSSSWEPNSNWEIKKGFYVFYGRFIAEFTKAH
jgi:hypothetical protein